MSYSFRNDRMYRMPTHFGGSLGPRQGPDGRRFPCVDTPKQTIIRALFEAKAHELARFLPPKFYVIEPAFLCLSFTYATELEWLAGRGYNMFGVTLPASFRGTYDRLDGEFLLVLWENMADPIITGREDLGFSKLYCEIPQYLNFNGDVICRASWDGCEFATLKIAGIREAAPDSIPAVVKSSALLNYKYIPKTGAWGEADVEYPVATPAENPNARIERSMVAENAVHTIRRSTWEELPTLFHIVNALADLSLGKCVQATMVQTRGGKDLRDQRILR